MKIVVGCLVLLLVAVVTPLTQEQKQRLEPYSKKCKLESGAPDDLLQRARNGDFVDDIRVKKQILCVTKQIGFVNEAGEPVVEKFKESIKKVAADDAEVKRMVKKCIVKYDTPEDTIFNICKCLMGRFPKWSAV